MEEFRKFIDQVGIIWSLVLSGGVLLPLVGVFAGLAPRGADQEPSRLATITGLLVLVVILSIWVWGRRLSPRATRIVFALLTVLAVSTLVLHVSMASRFQKRWTGREYIAGCGWTELAQKIALDANRDAGLTVVDTSQTCPGDPEFMYKLAATPEEVYTSAGMERMEWWLYAIWALLSFAWVALIGFFAIGFLRTSRTDVSAQAAAP